MPRYFVTDDANLVNGPFDDDDVRESISAEEAAERYADWNYSDDDVPTTVYVVNLETPGHYDVYEIDVVDDMWSITFVDSV